MLISMAKKGWRRFLDSDVTRRDGWLRLIERGHKGADGWVWNKTGEPVILEAIEWSPRVGARWVCYPCGTLGPKDRDGLNLWECPRCGKAGDCRLPTRGRFVRVLDARREKLVDMEPPDLEREGFPELSRVDFFRLYLGRPRAARKEIVLAALEHDVTRIEYEHLERRTG